MIRPLRLGYFAPLQSIHTKRWLDHFQRLGHDVYVFVDLATGFQSWPLDQSATATRPGAAPPPPAPLPPAALVPRIKRLYLPLRPVYSRVARLFDTPRELRHQSQRLRAEVTRLRFDILHAHWLWYHATYCLQAGVHPFLLTAWGSDIREAQSLPVLERWFLRRALRRADAVTAGSPELLQLCQAWGARPERCYTLGCPGVDPDLFQAPPGPSLAEQLGLPATAEIILSCRALSQLYGIEIIVEAFRLLAQQRPQATLLLLDYGTSAEYRDRIRRQVETAALTARVRWLDALPYDKVPAIYAGSRLTVMVPEQDGLPQCALEAMAGSCPIVASDLSTYNGFIDHGVTGLRVDRRSPAAVAAAMLRLLADEPLRQRLVGAGQRLVRERGDIRFELTRMELLYQELVEPSPLPR